MNVLHPSGEIGGKNSADHAAKSTVANQASRSLHPLTAQEIKAVAGGPESEVGNGVSPP